MSLYRVPSSQWVVMLAGVAYQAGEVADDGSRASHFALLWAAQEARLRQKQLVIAFLDAQSTPGTASSSAVEARLEAGAVAASRHEPSVMVGTALLRGHLDDELVELTRAAALVVVGLDGFSDDAIAQNVLQGRIVGQAACPVVLVPDLGRPHPVGRDVVVLWWGSDEGAAALHAAAREAVIRTGSLTVMLMTDEETTSDDRRLESRPSNTRFAMTHDVTAVRRSHPQLKVTTVRQGPGATTAFASAEGAALLVLSHRGVDGRDGRQLGPVTLARLGDVSCPIMLVTGSSREDAAPGRP